MTSPYDSIRAVDWRDDALHLLDQRRLPQRQDILVLNNVADVAQAIRDMVVRGAPAIGIAAAYGVVLAARNRIAENPATWRQTIESDFTLLANSRPTAVNLFWALARMRTILEIDSVDPVAALLAEAHRIREEDISANRRMGELGAALIDKPCAVMTHCNTGSLATGGYGTALGVIRSAFAAGKITKVFAGETRPWLQGARLTAWELVQDEIPVTLLVEGAASRLLQQGEVGWVVVGADRIAANGDTANKIGTYQLAVSARFHGLKFMVVAPTATIDLNIADGSAIPIENRASEEVLQLAGQPTAALGAQAWNPAFDITPAALIDALVTERGVVLAPDRAKIQAMMEKA